MASKFQGVDVNILTPVIVSFPRLLKAANNPNFPESDPVFSAKLWVPQATWDVALAQAQTDNPQITHLGVPLVGKGREFKGDHRYAWERPGINPKGKTPEGHVEVTIKSRADSPPVVFGMGEHPQKLQGDGNGLHPEMYGGVKVVAALRIFTRSRPVDGYSVEVRSVRVMELGERLGGGGPMADAAAAAALGLAGYELGEAQADTPPPAAPDVGDGGFSL